MEPFTWQAYEYPHRKKTPDWFFAVAIISASLAAAAVVLDNGLFGVFIVIGATALLLYARRKPGLLTYEINEKGIRVSRRMYPYGDIESFGIVDIEGDEKILLKLKTFFAPLIAVPLGETDPESVRALLERFLPEEAHEEPLSQRIMELIGF